MPSCVICYFRDVVQIMEIMEGVLRMYFNLIVGVCYLSNFLYFFVVYFGYLVVFVCIGNAVSVSSAIITPFFE